MTRSSFEQAAGESRNGTARPAGAAAPDLGRRSLLRLAAAHGLAGAGALAADGCAWQATTDRGHVGAAAEPPPLLRANPFSLGVASGEPRPDGFVIWTRLLPDPADIGSIEPVAYPVRWEVSEDEGFGRVVASGQAWAWPDRAHSVHVDIQGLSAARTYWYRFHAGRSADAATSHTGRTRTAPAPGAMPQRARFAIASCQHYEQGFFGAYQGMLADEVDLVLFLGDYIYESNKASGGVRAHRSEVPRTLEGYRARYAQYRTDPDLQRMHAAAPWVLTWDDHEVENDYAGNISEDLAAGFAARRAAAYQAWAEHMPVRAMAHRPPPSAETPIQWAHWRIEQAFEWGRLARVITLDDRQYRSPQACPRPGRGGGNVVDAKDCPSLFDPDRTMLGLEQERWLEGQMGVRTAVWNLIAQQTLFSKIDGKPGPGESFWTDGWDGYPAARRRLLQAMVRTRMENPLILSGDVHAHWVCDVKADFDDPASPVIATEFCGTSITSPGGSQARHDAARAENPWVKLAESRWRGYLLLDLQATEAQASLRIIDDVAKPKPVVSTLARFRVRAGHPGAQAL
jgi:alkaline phosphatase D